MHLCGKADRTGDRVGTSARWTNCLVRLVAAWHRGTRTPMPGCVLPREPMPQFGKCVGAWLERHIAWKPWGTAEVRRLARYVLSLHGFDGDLYAHQCAAWDPCRSFGIVVRRDLALLVVWSLY